MDYLSAPSLVLAADTANMEAGEDSLLPGWMSKGATAAAVSGVLSIANTFIDYAGGEQIDVGETLRGYDEGTFQYYQKHQDAIDLAGFIGTSLLPGGLGMAGFKALNAGRASGIFARTTGYFSSRAASNYANAVKALGPSGGTLTTEIIAARRAGTAFAVADQALTAAAGEIAIALTMNDSPIFEKSNGWDFASNIMWGAAFGGVIGGAVEHLISKGIFKDAQRLVQGRMREFDTIFDPKELVKQGLDKTDEVASFVDRILALPDNYYDVPFQYTPYGKKVKDTMWLETSGAMQTARSRTEKVAFDEAAIKFNDLAGGAENIGQAYYGMVYNKIQQGRQAGKLAEFIRDDVAGYLQGIKRISALDEDTVKSLDAPDQFFINTKPDPKKGVADLLVQVKGKTTGKQAYYVAGDAKEVKWAVNGQFATLEDAWEAGMDLAPNSQGFMSVNPKSTRILRTPDKALNTRFLVDLETGELSKDAVLTAADMMKRGTDFDWGADYALLNGKRYAMPATMIMSPDGNSVEQSLRFMWASKLEETYFKGKVIDWQDFPLLDAAQRRNLVGENAPSIRMPDGEILKFDDMLNTASQINDLKRQWLSNALEKLAEGEKPGWKDIRHWSLMLNHDRGWIENAITSGFRMTSKAANTVRGFDAYFRPQTVLAQWDEKLTQVGELMGPNHMSGHMLGSEYRIKTIQLQSENAFAAVMGKDAERFIQLEKGAALTTNVQGAGATALGASNADYGSRARIAVQELGKTVSLVAKEWRDAALGRLSSHVVAIRANKDIAAELGILTTALRRDAGEYYLKNLGSEVEPQWALVEKQAWKLYNSGVEEIPDLESAIAHIQTYGEEGVKYKGMMEIKNEAVAKFLQESQAVNAKRLEHRKTLFNAVGIITSRDPEIIKAPPIDTVRYPYHAFVVPKGELRGVTDVSMITARSPEQLKQLMEAIPEGYEGILKSDTKRYFKAKGIYDYDQTLRESQVNSALKRTGKLGDFYPETRAENVLTDWVNWHANAETGVVREAVQVRERQFFSEVGGLAERWKEIDEATFGGRGFILKKKVENPFQDYITTALDMPKRGEAPLLEALNEFVDKTGIKLYEGLNELRNGVFSKKEAESLASLEEANALMSRYGLEGGYEKLKDYLVANERMPQNLIKTAFQKANYILATATLRLDAANALVNVISTPIMLGTELRSIRSAVAGDSELAGKLRELTHIKVPGGTAEVPGLGKAIGTAIQNWFGPNKKELIAEYLATGDMKGNMASFYHEMLDDLSYLPGKKANEWIEKVNKAVEKGSKFTGNDFAEDFTRFVASNVMDQITGPIVAAGKMTQSEARAYRGSFVNRVQGNYIASQRPVFFQGTTGAAVGLFQTYAFNVFQQLFRHIENRDAKTALTFAALQSTVYGLNGLPFFDAINQHLIGNAAGNAGHKDIYSVLPAADKEWGNWMLYGTASAFPFFGDKSPALYTRGDINPRHLSIIPINPIDIPAVQGSIRLVDSITGFASKMSKGGDLVPSFLQALEHQGLNRPLAGFAQILAGQSTTSQGSLIAASNDMLTTSYLAQIPERLVNFGGVARLMGAKPMDESVALNAMYRSKAYDAVDRARLQALGGAVKTKLQNNQMPDPEELDDIMERYVRSGGRIENFSSSMQHWMRDANESIVNQVGNHLRRPTSQRLMEALGGEKLNDYSTMQMSQGSGQGSFTGGTATNSEE